MKKIFTLFAAATMALAARAAAPELLFRGAPIAADETGIAGYELTVLSEEIPGFGAFTFYTYTQDAHLSVKGEASKSVTVELSASSDVQMCGLLGGCSMGSAITRSNVLSSSPDAAIVGSVATVPLKIDAVSDFDTEVDPNEVLKEITIEVTAYYTDAPAEKATAKVLLTKLPDDQCGISAVAPDNVNISYARGIIDYTVAAPAKLEIYNTSGALVISRVVASTGSVSLDALRPGVYIYSLGGKTGKILLHK